MPVMKSSKGLKNYSLTNEVFQIFKAGVHLPDTIFKTYFKKIFIKTHNDIFRSDFVFFHSFSLFFVISTIHNLDRFFHVHKILNIECVLRCLFIWKLCSSFLYAFSFFFIFCLSSSLHVFFVSTQNVFLQYSKYHSLGKCRIF